MVISRTVVVARVDAKHAIDAADRTTYGAADDPADRTSSGVAFRRAAFHSAKNALSMSSDWRSEQSHNHGYSKFLPHRYLSHPGLDFPINPPPPGKFHRRAAATLGHRPVKAAAQISWFLLLEM
jgi:hypothetical protein